MDHLRPKSTWVTCFPDPDVGRARRATLDDILAGVSEIIEEQVREEHEIREMLRHGFFSIDDGL
jgi:hypothetical protein